MPPRPIRFIAAFVALTAATLASAETPPAGQHPVTWSAALGLASLADIGARLAKPFGEPIGLSLKGHAQQAANCLDLLKLRKAGYGAEGDRGYALERYEGARCLALTLLKKARPARVSHLEQFQLNPSVLSALPPSLATTFSAIEDAAGRQAESAGKSLGQYRPGLNVRQEGDVLVVSSDTWESRIEPYARGDFDGDGVEDLLVAVGETATQGTFDSTKLLLLTRKNPQGPLRTVKQLQ